MEEKKVLRVNLTKGTVKEEPINKEWMKQYIGGRGYATKLLYEELKKGTDPLSEDNILIFANGPLTGSSVPTGGRYMVVTKSPLTGLIASSNSGGYWGAELARAGYMLIVVEGKAKKPVYLWIKDGKAELRDAASLWGKDTHQTTDAILKELGDDKVKVACIGPAGEKLSRIACIINDKHRAAGRSGVGAVMGSKNLKAVAVKGSGTFKAANPEALKETLRAGMQKIKENGVTGEGLPTYGTAVLVNILNQLGSYPHRNFQESVHDEAEKHSGERLAETFLTGKSNCFACPIGCGRVTALKDKHGEGPEYETLWAFGSNCGVAELEPIIRANYLCNELGLDTISAGGTISAAMELYEKGYIKKEELGSGPELRFGSEEALVYWTEKMGKLEGLGAKMAQGSHRLCESYGHPEFSITVKKQELPAYDPRGIQGIGLTFAVSNRGACHVRGYLISPEVLGIPEKLDPWATEGKAQWAKIFHDLTAAIDSSGMCLFTSFALGADEYAEMLKHGAGLDLNAESLLVTGDRIWNIERLFNLREGLDPAKDDTLPTRLLTEPIPAGPAKGKLSKVKDIIPEYYKLRGWDAKGVPTPAKLAELGLK
ncbi:MAG: aldehyde ferredoxin oxidoreductase family protein [Thermovirgaceae bacterium]|nr:aldehyde ferredoxin oxidoreductase family protein [Thermovirgaceae bacterium]